MYFLIACKMDFLYCGGADMYSKYIKILSVDWQMTSGEGDTLWAVKEHDYLDDSDSDMQISYIYSEEGETFYCDDLSNW